MFKSAIALLFVFLAAGANAVTVTGTVNRFFTDYPNYGWCMAEINVESVDGTGVTTCDSFVSFGCDGLYVPKASGNLNFQAIQLAFLTNARVAVGVREDLLYTVGDLSYCLGQRVDILVDTP